jgi:hypothetical protein
VTLESTFPNQIESQLSSGSAKPVTDRRSIRVHGPNMNPILEIEAPHEPVGSAGFPACGFTGLSSPVSEVFRFAAGTGDWKVARTRRLESLRYSTAAAPGVPNASHLPNLHRHHTDFVSICVHLCLVPIIGSVANISLA